jgi:hypothetical protein
VAQQRVAELEKQIADREQQVTEYADHNRQWELEDARKSTEIETLRGLLAEFTPASAETRKTIKQKAKDAVQQPIAWELSGAPRARVNETGRFRRAKVRCEKDLKTMRIVGYARVSTTEQTLDAHGSDWQRPRRQEFFQREAARSSTTRTEHRDQHFVRLTAHRAVGLHGSPG